MSLQFGGDLDMNGHNITDATLTVPLILDFGESIAQFYTNSAASTGVQLSAYHDSATPADGDLPLDIMVIAGADDEEVGRIALELDDGSTTSEDTRWRFFNDVAGSSVEILTLVGGGAFVTGTVDASNDLDAGDDLLIADDINFGGSDVLISYAANDLEFSGVTGDYGFDDDVIVVGKVDASTDVDAAGDLIAGDDALLTDDIDFGGGDVQIAYSANDLAFTGVTGDYSFDDSVFVVGLVDASTDVDAGGDLISGDDVNVGDDVNLIEGASLSWDGGDCVITQTNNVLDASSCAWSGASITNVADADYGDITVSSGVWNIDADTVTPTELAEAGNYDFTGTVTLDSDALQIDDTNASHQLVITPGSDLSADRVLTLTTGDAARTLTISDNATLNDADYGDITTSSDFTVFNLDADVVTPTELAEAGDYAFTGTVTFDADAVHIFDTNASHDLIITPGSDLSADRVFTITTGDAARTLTMGGNATLSDADKGDITTGTSFTDWQIDAGVIGPTEIATDAVSSDELDMAGVEAEIEGALDTLASVTAIGGDVTCGGDCISTDDIISGDDVLLSDTGVINFGAGDCTLTEGTDVLTIAGTCGLRTENVSPAADATHDLGTTALGWNNLHFDTGAVINFENGDVLITMAANDLAFSGVTGDYSFDDTVGVTGDVTATTAIVAGFSDAAPGAGNLAIDDEGSLFFFEAEANGDNSFAFVMPSTFTSDVTCTFENDANPIPDSCVGDGSDAGGAGSTPGWLYASTAAATGAL
jgi:hypothetical protein